MPYGYCDDDYNGCPMYRKCTSEFVFLVSEGTITWCSKNQTPTAASTSEADYAPLAAARQEAVRMDRKFRFALNSSSTLTTCLQVDNEAVLKIAKLDNSCSPTKHIDVKLHIVREHLRARAIRLNYCQANEKSANLLSKPLARLLMYQSRASIG